MSIPVDVADVAQLAERFAAPTLMTIRAGAVKVVHAEVHPHPEGLSVRPVGRASRRNVVDRPNVTLLWPPREDPGFSLIADGIATPDGDELIVEVTSAVLHKPVALSDETAGHPFWVSAFIDVDARHAEATFAFWAAVSGTTLSDPRGDNGEFATLVPPTGHDHLRVQRLGASSDGSEKASRVHLDLHVPDIARAAARAEQLGAVRVGGSVGDGYVTLRSPGGLVFCFVPHPACLRAAPAGWGEHTSVVDQVCIDTPAQMFEEEVAFFAALTGWGAVPDPLPAFTALRRPAGQPVRLLVQRLEAERGTCGAHLDVSTTDRAAEVARHRALGAELLEENERWSVLRDPSGAAYCITDRAPQAG